MSICATTKRPMSIVGRMHAANAAADARRADKLDEGNHLKRKARAAFMGLAHVQDAVSREWHKLHDPVPTPTAVGNGRVHPSRAAALAEFVRSQGWSSNPLEDVAGTPSRDDIGAEMVAAARQELAEADAAFAAYEFTKHE